MSQRLLSQKPSLAVTSKNSSPFQSLVSQRLNRRSAAGNSLDTATSIRAYRGDRTYRDRVSAKSPDFYKLRLLDESDINAVFRNRSSSTLLITALDADGNPANLGGTDAKLRVRAGKSVPIDSVEIPSGTYYLKVSTRGGESAYRLTIAIERSCGCG